MLEEGGTPWKEFFWRNCFERIWPREISNTWFQVLLMFYWKLRQFCLHRKPHRNGENFENNKNKSSVFFYCRNAVRIMDYHRQAHDTWLGGVSGHRWDSQICGCDWSRPRLWISQTNKLVICPEVIFGFLFYFQDALATLSCIAIWWIFRWI